jgi:Uma2 family endonuclease
MASLPIRRYTPEQYLAIERAADFKSEYISGEIVAMAGTTRRHSLIKGNVEEILRRQVKGGPCETHSSDLRVQARNAYFYPDLVVVCGDVQLLDDTYLDTLLNPTVIVEILSKSTESDDRGIKFMRYGMIPSLRDYILVSQDSPRVEHFARTDDGEWMRARVLTEPADVLDIGSIDCKLSLAEIYDRIVFDE